MQAADPSPRGSSDDSRAHAGTAIRVKKQRKDRGQAHAESGVNRQGSPSSCASASAVPKMRVNGRGEDVIFFDGVFFKSSLKSIFFVS